LTENRDFFKYSPVFDVPVGGGVPVGVLPYHLVWKNQNGVIRWCNKSDGMFSRFDKISTYDRQTDRRTDGQLATA